ESQYRIGLVSDRDKPKQRSLRNIALKRAAYHLEQAESAFQHARENTPPDVIAYLLSYLQSLRDRTQTFYALAYARRSDEDYRAAFHLPRDSQALPPDTDEIQGNIETILVTIDNRLKKIYRDNPPGAEPLKDIPTKQAFTDAEYVTRWTL